MKIRFIQKARLELSEWCWGQSGSSKRPSSKATASEEARRTLRYVESRSEARTPLADFFSILLKARKRSRPAQPALLLEIRFEARRGFVEDCSGGARESFVVRVVEGIDAELNQASGEQVEEFF